MIYCNASEIPDFIDVQIELELEHKHIAEHWSKST